jgi:glyoxalase family protein
MGYTFVGQEGDRQRFRSEGNRAVFVDLLNLPNEIPGKIGAGSVHHVAFRASDDAEQIRFHRDLSRTGQQVTQVRDRQYFHSIYFREPGGVLFEIATDTPGFLIDEPIDTLGTHLKLPPWLEDHRDDIEAALPTLEDAHV